MLPAPLKKLRIVDMRPVSPDRIYFNFHLKSANAQKPSTLAVWTRDDKKPFPTAKLDFYAHSSCLLPDGRFLMLNSEGPSMAFDGLEGTTFETPVIENNTWMCGAVVDGELMLGGNWGNLQRRDASGTWHTVSPADELPRIRAIVPHPGGGALIAGDDGTLLRYTDGVLAKIEHPGGSTNLCGVCLRASGTLVAIGSGRFVRGTFGGTLEKIDHPSGKDFLDIGETSAGVAYLTADDAVYEATGTRFEPIACPIRPDPLLGVRIRGDAAYVFNDSAAYQRTGGDWTQVA